MNLNRKVLKLKFKTALHYGNNGKPGLLSSDNMVLSDTIYSAMCDISPEDIDKLLELVENKKLLISDMLPYVGDKLLIPKGIGMIKFAEDEEVDRTTYKKIKKLDYLPVDKVEEMATKCNERLIEESLNLQNKIGTFSIKTSNSVGRDNEDTIPFIMEIFTFYDNAGLYLLVDYDTEETFNFVKDKIVSLGLLGIGGKRSSGLGKYEVIEITDFPSSKNEGKYLLLSTALPEEEIELNNFGVVKRSGFYEQENEAYKKRDVFAIKSGLVVDKPFNGVILKDLAKKHKVYRFLMPLFVRLEI